MGATAAEKVSLRVHNLGPSAESVNLTPSLPEGLSLTAPAGELSVTVPPQGYQNLDLVLQVRNDPRLLWNSPALRLTGRTAGGLELSPLVLHFSVVSEKLEDWLSAMPNQTLIPLELAANWQDNVVGGCQSNLVPGAFEGRGWRQGLQFPAKCDAWAYPYFNLPETVKFRENWRLLVRARCQGAATVRLMLIENDGSAYMTANAIIPDDGEWHVRALASSDFMLMSFQSDDENTRLDAEQIHRLQLGLNSSAKDGHNEVEVSALYLVQP